MLKLKSHLLPHILEIHMENHSNPPSLGDRSVGNKSEIPPSHVDHVVFKGNQIYRHPLLRINHTTYDLRCETEAINPRTDHRDVMLLTCTDGSGSHPFCYARILAIYHANVVYIGPESQDY